MFPCLRASVVLCASHMGLQRSE